MVSSGLRKTLADWIEDVGSCSPPEVSHRTSFLTASGLADKFAGRPLLAFCHGGKMGQHRGQHASLPLHISCSTQLRPIEVEVQEKKGLIHCHW
jgi:hypothetical protein